MKLKVQVIPQSQGHYKASSPVPQFFHVTNWALVSIHGVFQNSGAPWVKNTPTKSHQSTITTTVSRVGSITLLYCTISLGRSLYGNICVINVFKWGNNSRINKSSITPQDHSVQWSVVQISASREERGAVRELFCAGVNALGAQQAPCRFVIKIEGEWMSRSACTCNSFYNLNTNVSNKFKMRSDSTHSKLSICS